MKTFLVLTKSLIIKSLVILLLTMSSVAVMAAVQKERIESIAAIVNEDIITSLELESAIDDLKRELSQQPGIQLPTDEELQKQILDRLIVMRIQLQRAERGNIRIDDDAVNAAIGNIAKQNNMDLMSFRRALESRGFDYSAYRERIRDEMIIGQLQRRQVNNRIVITEQEIDDLLATQARQGSDKDEYRLEHILIVVPEAANPAQVNQAKQRAEAVLKELEAGATFSKVAIAKSEGQQALSGGDLGWRKLVQIPTLFSDQVRNMQVGDVSGLIRSPSGYHIIHVADKRRDEKRNIVQQTKARHILLKPSIELPADDVKIRLQQLKQRIEAGESFSDIAAAHSQDKGSATQGGDLGWVSPGVMVKEFEEEMDKLDPGELSDPFRSRFGWHILLVEERRDFDNTESMRRNNAREILMKRKLEPAIENWIRQLRDESFVEVRL